MYSVHQSFMWFLWLNWCKSTFYPITAPNNSKCWPIVMSSLQEPAASICDVTMTDCSRVVAMDAFLTLWCWGQWFNEFVKDTHGPSFSTLWKKSVKPWNVWHIFVTPMFPRGIASFYDFILPPLIYCHLNPSSLSFWHGGDWTIIRLQSTLYMIQRCDRFS